MVLLPNSTPQSQFKDCFLLSVCLRKHVRVNLLNKMFDYGCAERGALCFCIFVFVQLCLLIFVHHAIRQFNRHDREVI